jgi:hypothetical protein
MQYINCTPHIVRVYTPRHVMKETTWKGRDGLANKIVQEFDLVEKAWRLPREFAMPMLAASVVKYTLKANMPHKWEFSGTNVQLREGGGLADIAPTLLAILGLPQPTLMTGQSLVMPVPLVVSETRQPLSLGA